MLLFNRKATANEMLAWGFVSRVVPHAQFEEKTKAMVTDFAKLSAQVRFDL